MEENTDKTNGAGAPPPEPAVTPPAKIPEADMYKVSNCALRLQNLMLQKELLRRDEETTKGQLAMAFDEINKKYGLDPAKHRVLPDGTIVPADHPMVMGQAQLPRA